jgi:hypothetical protein
VHTTVPARHHDPVYRKLEELRDGELLIAGTPCGMEVSRREATAEFPDYGIPMPRVFGAAGDGVYDYTNSDSRFLSHSNLP